MKKLLLAAVLAGLPAAGHAAATDCSGTIAAKGVAIQLIPAGTQVTSFMLQNIENYEAAWYAMGSTAALGTAGSFVLAPAQAKGFSASSTIQVSHPAPISAGKLTVVAATVGHRFSCVYW